MSLDLPTLQSWIGKSREEQDQLNLAPMRAMAALLDRDPDAIAPHTALPPLWHWLYFLSPARQSDLAADGHPRKGDFLPPVPLNSRMWAGGRLHFQQDLRGGEQIARVSTIRSIDAKPGRSGQLVFVCVAHEISGENGPAIREEHDIVYRDRSAAGATQALPPGRPAPRAWDFCASYNADPTLLFRYSALTFNAHRIHYDRDYVIKEEGYPGLLVHGPLLATLLTELLRANQPTQAIQSFEFRAIRPVFDSRDFRVCGSLTAGGADLWVADQDNFLCMQANAVFASGPA